ncbi:2-C-methyl-D-erythritol 4-phosphate cytidylyltransferase [Bacteroidales bacterium OttesenSCG-928-K03]|nr:2-C-methyl-D-erythritol 4-phosphate cytidylyltransferase [Odoribacter sp. OttesenSCG-928-L07]MDL2242630.1 2-C-methyl-D-erythritol 4-phosphate cytidylyltransferase [Bacteroidales bacterium OttesenSCG-928-K03]
MNIAIILAGGTGSRIGENSPKQFIKIAEKSIIEHSINAFEKNDNVDKISIVINKDYHAECNAIIKENNYKKIDKIINGGKERYESSFNAVKAYEDLDDCNLIFHDSARPLVSQRIIDETVAALKNYNAVSVAIPTTDTIYKINTTEKTLESVLDRSKIFCAQTPQAFKISIIREAYKLFFESSNFVATDDCGIVSRFLPNEKIYIVTGDIKNMKITYKEDIDIAEKLLLTI